jgi:uncharacterized protein (TIGR02147 family)
MVKKESWKPDIFSYLDYREYLGDYYVAAKKESKAFSYRYFSRKAGFSSPNFLKLVIEGKRNISEESITRFGRALKLSTAEQRFFSNLVAFCQAENEEKKNEAFERVAASRRFKQARRLDGQFYLYLSRWYYPAVREMVARHDFIEDPEWIAKQLLPPIHPNDVLECLEVLLDLGLVERNSEGELGRGDPSITTGHQVHNLAVSNYHRQMLKRASDSIETVSSENRDISAMTVSIANNTIADLKSRIHNFKEGVLDRCDRDEKSEVVYQINIQLFPLTQVNGEQT